MSTSSDEWLALAPKPRPLAEGQRWHVFLSYRSVHRSWVIQLYDVLRHFGYEVFLDQYVLTPAKPLVASLEEGLAKSAAGILVWSTDAADSRWCQKEYTTMQALEMDSAFRYVVALLDNVDLKANPFLSQKLYLDFSQFREGPRGAGLLQLLYGLTGEPQSDEAVRLALKVDEETRSVLAKIKAAQDRGDDEYISQLAKSQSLAWTTSPLLGSRAAESLIKLSRLDDALVIIKALEERFPKAIRPRQLEGLALARKGELKAAQRVLSELWAEGEQDPETLGIYARTWMDRYTESGDRLHLVKSRDLYAQAFKNAPKDYYTGINAAAKSVFLGELEEAARYADAVEQVVGTQKYEGNYWMTATAAEVQLIKQNYDQAAVLYAAAVAMSPTATGDHKSTWIQAKRLLDHLKPTPEQNEKIAQVFAHLAG
jgi:TIR domain-containing protein/tetratricopeptide repeat protein